MQEIRRGVNILCCIFI